MKTAVKQAEPASRAGHISAARATTGPSAAARLLDQRPGAIAQRQRQAAIDSSPRVQEAATAQRAIDNSPRQQNALAPVQRKANKTGLPDHLKASVENLSGHSLDDVRVHYNSAKPAQLQAHAYAQGTDIHLGPGQEKYLPHEAWHVVQQKQGRVRPTRQLKEVMVNDDSKLESEADSMGAKAFVSKIAQPNSQDVVGLSARTQLALGGGEHRVKQAKRIHQFVRRRRKSKDGAWTPKKAGKGTRSAGAGNQGMNTVAGISKYNIASLAYSAVDNATLGTLSDVVDLGGQMMSHDEDDTWPQAFGRRAEATVRFGLRMAGRLGAFFYGGPQALAGVGVARHVYPAITDRLAAAAVTQEGNDSQNQGWGEYLTRKYYRLAHGEGITTTGWRPVTNSTGGTRDTKKIMGITASKQAGGITHKRDRLLSRQWTHLQADSLGGETEQGNLTSASQGANIAMTPGEEHLAASHKQGDLSEVKTTAFERTGLPVARGLNFQGRVNGERRFNQNIDGARWPLSKAEQKRFLRAVDGTSLMPSAVREIPLLSSLFGK